jgi:hypothetical protein
VLGHSSHAWTVPAKAGPVSGASVTATSDHGPILASLSR